MRRRGHQQRALLVGLQGFPRHRGGGGGEKATVVGGWWVGAACGPASVGGDMPAGEDVRIQGLPSARMRIQ